MLIRTANRITNAAAALLRTDLGWRYDMPEAERKKVNRQALAIARSILKGTPPEAYGGQALQLAPYAEALDPIERAKAKVHLEMEKTARMLPVHAWTSGVRGFGDRALAVIVAEAGDLAHYPHRDKLWKRFGLTPYDGRAASTWRRTKEGGLSAEEWKALGYAPRRNAESFAMLNNLQSMLGPYRDVYYAEKGRFYLRDEPTTPKHAHIHGLRCLRKAMLEDLWRVWNGWAPRHAAVQARQ